MPGHDIIVIGASAGGVEALKELVCGLPEGYPGSIFIVVHFPATATSVLPAILNRAGPVQAVQAVDQSLIRPGRIYVGVPDRHLLVKRGHIQVTRGPRENGARPAIDPLFRTAARAYGPRVVGVVLSGSLGDGAAGLMVVKDRGGVAVVQDPEDAQYDSMPTSAIGSVAVDYVLPVSRIADLLVRLANEPVPAGEEPLSGEEEIDIAEAGSQGLEGGVTMEKGPSVLTCPECGGVLWEIEDGQVLRYRCHVGHGYSSDSLLEQQSDCVESALWTALRTLEESAALNLRLSERAKKRGHSVSEQFFSRHAREAEERAKSIRTVLIGPVESQAPKGIPPEPDEGETSDAEPEPRVAHVAHGEHRRASRNDR